MAYDGKVMRLALQRFEEDRQRRQAGIRSGGNGFLPASPACGRSTELRSTMSRIITSAPRHGTDPRSAVAVLRDENLSLQAEKRELLQKMGLPEDALEETPACALCGDTGYRNGRVRCLQAITPGSSRRSCPGCWTWGTRALTPSPQTGTRTAMTRTSASPSGSTWR
ncbi:MAG: hypothetical protein ACLTYN_02670 [Dysosmobacter welbionis]